MGSKKRKSLRATTEMEDLPIHIIHHIQSFLKFEDAARTSLVSKSWLLAPSFLKLRCRSNKSPEEFVKSVSRILGRYQRNKLPLEKLRLSTDVVESELVFGLNENLKLATSLGLKELEFYVNQKYTLPLEIFQSTLQRFLVIGGTFEDRSYDQIFKSHSLMALELYNVVIHEGVIDTLLSSFPCILKITIKFCEGFSKILVHDLPRIKVLDITQQGYVEVHAYGTPCLQSFAYEVDRPRVFREPPVLRIQAMDGLKRLSLTSCWITDLSFKQLISKFPFLEELVLTRCDSLTNIEIICESLKRLTLRSCKELKNVEVHAPELCIVVYCGSHGNPGPVFTTLPDTVVRRFCSH